MNSKIKPFSVKPTSLGEGIPFNQYNLLQLIFAIPIAVLLELLFGLQRIVTTDKGVTSAESIPSNALIVTFHGDSYLDPLSLKTWNHLISGPYCWLGFHGFLSYIGALRAMIMRIRAFRYKTKSKLRPMDQVREFLKTRRAGQLMLRTDAGGPYEKVRPSLIKLAIQFNRPLVCLRVSASKSFLINHHKIALPGSTIETRISTAIESALLEELASESMEKACEYVESKMKATLKV